MFLGLSWYFILMDFYLYSFFGWIYECSFCSLKEHKVIIRGFLVGPLLPLYGFGGTIVYVFLRPLEPHPSLLYLGGCFSPRRLSILPHGVWRSCSTHSGGITAGILTTSRDASHLYRPCSGASFPCLRLIFCSRQSHRSSMRFLTAPA